MNKPCEHCDKANENKYKHDYFKCEKPCNNAKQCQKNAEVLLRALRGEQIEKIMKL